MLTALLCSTIRYPGRPLSVIRRYPKQQKANVSILQAWRGVGRPTHREFCAGAVGLWSIDSALVMPLVKTALPSPINVQLATPPPSHPSSHWCLHRAFPKAAIAAIYNNCRWHWVVLADGHYRPLAHSGALPRRLPALLSPAVCIHRLSLAR